MQVRLFALLVYITSTHGTAHGQPPRITEDDYKWGAGVNTGIPVLWGDMSSFSKGDIYLGFIAGAQGEYRLNRLAGVSLTLEYGHSKIGSYSYSSGFYLNTQGVTSYYPPGNGPAVTYDQLYGNIRFFSAGVHLDLNIGRLLLPGLNPARWRLDLSPAIYLQHYSPTIYYKADHTQYTDGSLPRRINLGLGGGAGIRYRITPRIDLQYRMEFIWISNPYFDGIDCFSFPGSNMSWTNSVGLIYRIDGPRKPGKSGRKTPAKSGPSDGLRDSPWQQPKSGEGIENEPYPYRPAWQNVQAETVSGPETPDFPKSLPAIYFDDDAPISIDSVKYCNELSIIVNTAKARPERQIVINGYTYHTGEGAVSERVDHCVAMYNYLVAHGIDPKRITFGRIGAATEQERYNFIERSRRVEVVLK